VEKTARELYPLNRTAALDFLSNYSDALYLSAMEAMADFFITPYYGETGSSPGDDLKTLVSWMSGSFSSREQSEADTTYFDIRLEMVPIWTDREDGYWFYVEQAVAGYEDTPYRQRVYHVTEAESGKFRSDVYTIEEPSRLVGLRTAEDCPDYFVPDSLTLRDGCSIIMERKADGSFVGGTAGQNCASDLQGASYATAEVIIDEKGLYSWDRGFDDDGNQVWGAEKGGYYFRKIE